MRTLDIITFILMAIGALNWLLVGLFDLNLVAAIFGANTVLTNLAYIIVGLSAVYQLFTYRWSEATHYGYRHA
jgi:uncharacterized membrane protein YuzA (DUF378 family)